MSTAPERPTPAATILLASSRCWVELSRCLDDLRACLRDEAQGRTIEVITLHGPDDDSAVDVVKEECPDAKVLVSRRSSIPALFNLGARHARGDVLIFLDDNAWPHRGWLRALLAALENRPQAVAATPSEHSVRGTLTFGPSLLDGCGRIVPWGSATAVPAGNARALPESGFAVRRHAFFALGGFDERLCARYGAMDLAMRLHAAHGNQCTVHVEPGSVTRVHATSLFTAIAVERPWFAGTRSHIAFAARHRGLLRGTASATLTAAGRLSRAAWRSCTGSLRMGHGISIALRLALAIPCGWLCALLLPRKTPLQALQAPDPVLVPVDPLALAAKRSEPAVQARHQVRRDREAITA